MDGVSAGGAWAGTEIDIHINVKEMIAIYYALRSFLSHVTGLHVPVLCDNTTAVSVVNNMGTTRSRECNRVAQQIWKFCQQHNIWVTCAHIPGVENFEADFESRKQYKQAEWMLNREHFIYAVAHFNFTPELDCFASRINCQHKVYASFLPDPYATFIDAFSINWGLYNCYIFPPFSLIPRVLQKLRVDQATALCVFPHWPTQTWWPLMERMFRMDPLFMEPAPYNLVLPNQPEELHPLHHKMKIVICLLSGKAM